jgi:hypothetical protein
MSLFDRIMKARAKGDEAEVRKYAKALMRKQNVPVRERLSGRKVWRMVTADGYEVLTPWAVNERARRRAAGKVAKQSRKRNRNVRPTGGLR